MSPVASVTLGESEKSINETKNFMFRAQIMEWLVTRQQSMMEMRGALRSLDGSENPRWYQCRYACLT